MGGLDNLLETIILTTIVYYVFMRRKNYFYAIYNIYHFLTFGKSSNFRQSRWYQLSQLSQLTIGLFAHVSL